VLVVEVHSVLVLLLEGLLRLHHLGFLRSLQEVLLLLLGWFFSELSVDSATHLLMWLPWGR